MKNPFCKNNNMIIYNTIKRLGLRLNHILIAKAIQLISNNYEIIKEKDFYKNIYKKTIKISHQNCD